MCKDHPVTYRENLGLRTRGLHKEPRGRNRSLHLTDGEAEALRVPSSEVPELGLDPSLPGSRHSLLAPVVVALPRGQQEVWTEGPSIVLLVQSRSRTSLPAPSPIPRSASLTQVCAVLVGRLRRQQGQSGQLLDTDSRAGSQAPSKLQDGCNNNILAHACSRGCSS